MNLNHIKQQWYYRLLTNKYVLISIVFAIWILFLDANAWLTSHRELNEQIADKEQNIKYYKRGITRDQQQIKLLKDSAGLEKIARERYLMKRPNEEVYIIQHADSIKQNNDE